MSESASSAANQPPQNELESSMATVRKERNIKKVDRWFGHLTAFMNMVGTLTIVVVTVLVVADVIGTLWFKPIIGVNEFMQLSLPGIVFLQLANTLRENRQISSDVFVSKLKTARPRTSAALFSFYNLVGAVFMIGLAILMYPKALQAYTGNFTRGAQGIVEIPQWPSMALVVLGSAVMGIQYFLHFIRDALASCTGETDAEGEQGAAA